MNYGYNIAASGVLTAMHRQDVASNNLANLQTVGFKPDVAFTIPRQAARIEDRLFDMPSNRLLEKLGGGVLLGPSRTSFVQGPLQTTDNALDLAIEGTGFLMVGLGGGISPEHVRLTRDGRLTTNPQGELVTVAGGHSVLDENSRPIVIDPTRPIQIEGDGFIVQDGVAVARLKFVDVADQRQIRKVGENLFAPTVSGVLSTSPATGRIVQNHVEQSAVDPIQAMMAVQSAANAVNSSSRMLSIHDELTGRLINSLGRVTG